MELSRLLGETFPMRRWMYILIALFLSATSCGLFENKKDSVPPLPPGRRDYTWSVDTVADKAGGIIMGLWGANPKDVWVVTEGGLHTVYHYNGSVWSPWGQEVSPELDCIFGFAKDDIWAGGSDGQIYHFDGTQWSLAFSSHIKGISVGYSDIMSIWGASPSDVYAVGVGSGKSFLLHYDGRQWRLLLVPHFGVQLQRIRGEQGTLFIGGPSNYHAGTPDTNYIYRYVDGRLQLISSRISDATGTLQLNNVGNHTYFVNGDRLEIYQANTFIRGAPGRLIPFMNFPNSEPIWGVSGRSKNDLFLYTSHGIMQYNGTNTQYLLRIPEDMPSPVSRELIFKKEVFFTVWGTTMGTTNLIYHGVLPDTTKTNLFQ